MVYAYAVAALRTVQPGETLSETYTLYNEPSSDGCYPDGVYSFTDSAAIGPNESIPLHLSFDVECTGSRVGSVDASPPSID